MIQIFRAKLHGLHVTGADVDYHGSITLDPAHCRLAGIHPLQDMPPVDVNSLRRDLAQRGREPNEIDQFCDSHFC